jgi:hypothetical protein
MPYTSAKPGNIPSADELRARIPGWGADLDPSVRPAVPKERLDEGALANDQLPVLQKNRAGRERSIEHGMLTPVFGTAQPLHGVSGAIRRFAYDRFSEGQSAHWLILIVGDRVDAIGSHARSLFTARPDNPVTETGVLAEPRLRPIASRFGRGRVDGKHTWLDPVLVGGPWILAAAGVVLLVRKAVRLFRPAH